MAFFSKATATVAGFAAGAALANKVGSIVSQTQQAYNKTQFGDVAGAASAAGFMPVTKFKKNDFQGSPSALAAQSAQKALTSKNETFEMLTYPEDIGKYFIKFSFYEYSRKEALDVSKDLATAVVIFPIPTNLNENFSLTYNNAKLGPVIGAGIETVTKMIQGGVSSIDMNTLRDLGTTVSGALGVGAREAIKSVKGGETLLNNYNLFAGTTPNPHLAAIFEDIGLRNHSFTFRFSPKNSGESETLKKIIRKLKRRMLPGTDGASQSSTGPLFSFPDVVDISFGPKDIEPYLIKRSVLESMTVNYAPNGTPAFFKDGSPTDIEIGLNFKEVRVVTRLDYEDKPNNTTTSPAPVAGIPNDRGDF